MRRKQFSLFDPQLCRSAAVDALYKLNSRHQWRNPVMFVVWLGIVVTTLVCLAQWSGLAGNAGSDGEPLWFSANITLWLWFTVLFANFAEALAEGRSNEADEIRLVDLPPDDLRQRLKEGKVYLPGQAERAIEHFFRKGNLMALRELALRRTAERVDDQMRAYRHREEIERVWHTHDALLVCLGPLDVSDKVVRTAARLAARLGSPWHAVYVETPRLHRLPESQRRSILQTLKLAADLGAETVTLAAQDEAQAILDYAREHNLGKIVIGRRQQGVFWWRGRRFIDRLGQLGPDLDLIVVVVEGQRGSRINADEHLPPDLRGFAERWRQQIVGSLATVLLGELIAHPDKVLTQRHLLLAVWGPNAVEHTHYLRIYMGHLRQKLEQDP